MTTRTVIIDAIAPGASLQDLGRNGYLGQGVSRGGAADPVALFEGAALLGHPYNTGGMSPCAVEMAGAGGRFRALQDTRIALTGAPMAARIDDNRVVWNAVHLLHAGQVLTLGGVQQGQYGYLSLGGGIEAPIVLGARGTHFAAGLGQALQVGDRLCLGADGQAAVAGATGRCLTPWDRFGGGIIRIVPSVQTNMFGSQECARFTQTEFRRDQRANRMGVRLDHDVAPFLARDQLSVLSEVIVPGDIQVPGDGHPFVLLPECQTTGGYPRIATVISPDLPRVAQTAANEVLRFEFITRDQALEVLRSHEKMLRGTAGKVQPLVRAPHDIADLLSYQLIDGVISAHGDLDAESPEKEPDT